MSDTDEKEPTQQYAAAQQQAPDDTAHYEHDYADPDDDDYEPQTEEEREQMFISKTIKDCHDTIDQFNHHNCEFLAAHSHQCKRTGIFLRNCVALFHKVAK